MDGRLREIEQWLESAKAELQDGNSSAYIDRLYLLNAEIRNTLRIHHNEPAPPRQATWLRLLPILVTVAVVLTLATVLSFRGYLSRTTDENTELATELSSTTTVSSHKARPLVDAALNRPGMLALPGNAVISTAWWNSALPTPPAQSANHNANRPPVAAVVPHVPASVSTKAEPGTGSESTPATPAAEPVDAVPVDTVDSPPPAEPTVAPAEETRLDPGALIDALEKGLAIRDD